MHLKKQALQCGINIFEFWEMTYGEIIDYIEAYNEVKQNDMRMQAAMNHSLADLIGSSVARIINDKAEYPSLYQSYPNLFPEMKPSETPEQNVDLMTARLMEYARAHNKKRGEGNEC